MTEPCDLSLREILALLELRRLSAEDLMRSCVKRIEAREAVVQAWACLDADRAVAAARSADRSTGGGRLKGIPFGIKDVIDTCDMPTTHGSALYAGHRPAADASCVASARAAGGIALGKTVTTEFAGAAAGPTSNPWNPAHTPGGSSSGSAAAVAAGMVPVALGTQTGGSTIRPAAYCGIVGYKPSFGLIDRTGVKTLASSLDTVGIFARTVDDAALFASVLAHRPALAAQVSSAESPTLGIVRTADWQKLAPSARTAFEAAVATIAKSGIAVREIPTPPVCDEARDLHELVFGWEIQRAFEHETACHSERLASRTLRMLSSRQHIQPESYDAAVASARRARACLDGAMEGCDAWLTPAAAGEAPRGLEETGSALFNSRWTLLHVPCLSVPAGRGDSGLPLAVQVVGRRGCDAALLRIAARLEACLRSN